MDTSASAHRAAIDACVTATLAATTLAVSPVGPPALELMNQIATSSTGGKRLRALLVDAAHLAHGGTHREAAIGVGAAIELFQTAALLHDDVLDDSDTRRGRPAAHRALAQLHSEQKWLGTADTFGAAAGILAGDLTLVAAHRALADAVRVLPGDSAATVSALFADMAELVTMGQYLDMRVAAQPLAALVEQEESIRAVMRAKTASYSAEFPLALGAACAAASPESVSAMRHIGVPLGIAFQLRDDILGLTGSTEVTGKPAGDDIREGKRTMLVWRAWAVTDEEGRDVLSATLGNRAASDAEVSAAIEIIAATDAIERAENEIASLTDEATSRLRGKHLDPAGVEALLAIFTAATDRSA